MLDITILYSDSVKYIDQLGKNEHTFIYYMHSLFFHIIIYK